MVNPAPEPQPPVTPETGTVAVPGPATPPAQAQPSAVEGVAPAPAAPARPRRSRKVQILLILLIVLGGLVVVGGAAGVILYDQATKIDRSTPVVSADAFLNAAVTEANESVAGLYTCPEWPSKDAYNQVRGMLDPQARASWDSFSVIEQSESAATLEVRMRFLYQGDIAPSGEQMWRAVLKKDDGWRVCSMESAEEAG